MHVKNIFFLSLIALFIISNGQPSTDRTLEASSGGRKIIKSYKYNRDDGSRKRPLKKTIKKNTKATFYPADFEPKSPDFADTNKKGYHMAIRYLKGRNLKENKGTHPIYILRAPLNRFDGNPLIAKDIIVAVNGKALQKNPVYQFKNIIAQTRLDNGIINITRWRKGVISNFNIDLNLKVPDLTKSGAPNEFHDWMLGPTGMNGWMYCENTASGASRDARQILVTRIEEGSPAFNQVILGDVIIGIHNKKFDSDARKALAAAINKAEEKENKGQLKLLIWREGKEINITLTLNTLPNASQTSPYHCDKTEAIINRACDQLLTRELQESWIGYIDALGMMASGRKDLMPKVKAFAQKICVPGEVLNIETHVPMLCWKWSYKCIFLCEYYLLTGDKSVLPTIKEYSTKIAMGQSGVGSWGHTVAAKANTGSLHGHLGGYGAINQMGLTLMVSLGLAKKCGQDDPEILAAIKRGETFFSYYINKGAIPYGDHAPATGWFDDNGKSGSAAIMFDLLENKKGSKFYSSMVLGSSPSGREAGHTGCFWSHLWGGIGASRGGEKVMTAFTKKMDWAFTLERRVNGSFAFQDNAGEKGSKGEAKKKWDCTGARLLQLSVPKKILYITGKDMQISNPINSTRIRRILSAGTLYSNKEARMNLNIDHITELLCDPLPAVRSIGARTVLEQKLNCVELLLELLGSDDPNAQYGACYALRQSGYASSKAVAQLVELIENSSDLDLRLNALDALTGSDPEKGLAHSSKSAIPTLLKLAVKRFAIDPRRLLQRQLGFALFDRHGLITLHGIEGISDEILIPAIQALLTVDDGRSRSLVSSVYKKLNTVQIKKLWKDIYISTRDISPSGIMFADGVRYSGLKLMQEKNILEGVEMTISYMSEKRWGAGYRESQGIEILGAYGPVAKKGLENLYKIKEKWSTNETRYEDQLIKLNKAISNIENGKNIDLISILPYIDKNKLHK